MKHLKRISIILTASFCIFAASVRLFVPLAHANPSSFIPTNATSVSTTTLSYLNAGTGTSTQYFDSYASQIGKTADKAGLLVQFSGSSTLSILNINIEYSMGTSSVDCTVSPTLCDWYEDPSGFEMGYATSSKPYDISQVNKYVLNYASSSPGLGVVGATNAFPARRIVPIGTPTRFIRAIFTIPPGASSGGIWSKFVPVRQAI